MERLDPQRLEHTHWTEALADSLGINAIRFWEKEMK